MLNAVCCKVASPPGTDDVRNLPCRKARNTFWAGLRLSLMTLQSVLEYLSTGSPSSSLSGHGIGPSVTNVGGRRRVQAVVGPSTARSFATDRQGQGGCIDRFLPRNIAHGTDHGPVTILLLQTPPMNCFSTRTGTSAHAI